MKRQYIFGVVVLLLALAGWALVDRRRGGNGGTTPRPCCDPGPGPAAQKGPSPGSAPATSAMPNEGFGGVEAERHNEGVRNTMPDIRRRNGVFAFTGLGRFRRAGASLAGAFEEAMARQLADPRAYVAAGDRAMAREDFQVALECFDAARLLDPNNLDAAMGRAVALTAMGLPGEAERAYRDLLRLIPQDRTTRFNLGVSLMKIGRNSEAQELFVEIVRKDGNFLPAWYNLGTIYTAGGKLSLAREAWGKAAELAPKLAYPCMKLGEVLMDLDEPNEAILAFVEAARRDPNDPAAEMNLAAASVRIGSFGRAVLAAERAAGLVPDDAGVWASLGNLRAAIYTATREKSFLRDALDAWGRSLAIDPNQADVTDSVRHFRMELEGATSRAAGSGH